MGELFLSDLSKGESAVITKIKESSIRKRLIELGVCIGEIIEVKERSVFSTPILIKVCGYELCVGKTIAKTIAVKRQMVKNDSKRYRET